MATLLGVAYNFAFTGTDGIVMSGTGVGTLTLQSANLSNTADVADVRNAAGDFVQKTFYNFGNKATLEYLPRGSGIADAITQSTIPLQGAIITITTCTNMPALVASTWFVEGEPTISGGNTDYKKVTLTLSKYAGITAATSA